MLSPHFLFSWLSQVRQNSFSVSHKKFIQQILPTESHLFEDGVNLVHAADVGDRMTFERTVNMIQGRCSHLGHIVRTEMRENPVRYSGTQRKRIGNRVHKIERRCKSNIFVGYNG